MKSVLKVKSKNTQVAQEKVEPKYVEDKATEQYLDYINESGNVMRHNGDKYVNTGINLKGPRGAVGPRGLPGKDGITPHIGENGNWYIGEQDTGSKAALNTDEYVTKEELDETIGEASEILDSLEGYSGIGEKLNELETNLETKANKDGFYETLGAGTALNLQGNTSKDATFTYRTAGGTEDIASGLATIHSIKGNTVVWNQLVASEDSSFDYTFESDTAYYVNIGRLYSPIQIFASHKYYIQGNYNAELGDDDRVAFQFGGEKAISIMTNYDTSTAIATIQYRNGISRAIMLVDTTQTLSTIKINNYSYKKGFNVGDTISYSNLFIIDLTLMFGAGNEPSTVEEFEEWLTNNVGLQDYYEYSEPTMLSADANSLETVGFNQWDGTYSRDGYWYNASADTVGTDSNYAISNFISVFPNTEYFIKGTYGANVGMAFYDKDKVNLKQSVTYNNRTSFTFTTPTNAAYLKFTIRKANKNITNLNLSWSGIRNGEFEEYWKRTYPINVKQLTSNGTVIFPNGMNRVGNVYDEIVSVEGVTKAIKRIGSVDLGTLSWSTRTTCDANKVLSTDLTNRYVAKKMMICDKYSYIGFSSYAVLQPIVDTATIGVYSYETTSSASTTIYFVLPKNNNPVGMLYYELATPIEYEIDNFEMPLAYKVDDFGTEETKKDTFSLSPTFAITYGVNAVDTLRRLPTNYISKESMQNFLSALGVQMGGTWSMTLDNNEYKFSFVANSDENEGA